MAEKSLDEKLHDMDEANKIYEFAETVLGCNDKQADIMSRTMRHKFKWSGVRLLWNGGVGDVPVVAVDHVDQIREYFTRESYDFLLPTPKAAVEGFSEAIPGDLLDDALNGSQTAKGKLCLLLGGNNKDAAARTELLLRTERAKRDGANGAGDANPHGTTPADRRATSSNPFTKLRKPDGTIDKGVEKQIGSMIAAMGHKKVADIARAAKSPAAPLGLSLTGLPLRA
jgi:hypothetical protein